MLLQQCVRVRHHISRSVTAVLKCRNEPVHSCLGYTQCWRHSRSLKHHHLCTRTYSSETGSPPGSQSHAGEDVEEKQENTPASRILEEASLGGDDLDFPSDIDTQTSHKTYNDWNRDQTKTSFRPSVDPSTTSVLLFPGQGSQFPGMGKELLKYPNARRMYDVASAILGYDLLEICLNGPPERLMRTEFCQPAIYVTSLAAIEKLKEENPKAIENCITAAGFSVGELAALAFAGMFSFEDGLRMVKVRGEAMQQASEEVPSGMMTVFLRPESKLKFACHTARRYCSERLNIEDPVCQIANFLYPECKVVAGHEEALGFLQKNGAEFGLRRMKRIPVSGAFHTELMRSAEPTFRKVLKEIRLQEPIIPVHSNVTSDRYGKIKGAILKLLALQISKPVKWEQTMHAIYSRSAGTQFPRTYEVGPGAQLGTLLKMVNKSAWQHYSNVEV